MSSSSIDIVGWLVAACFEFDPTLLLPPEFRDLFFAYNALDVSSSKMELI